MWRATRRSIIHDAPAHFVGWETILEYYEKAKKIDSKFGTNERALYFVTFFETGGRKSEVLLLRPSQIYWNEDSIRIENMEVRKRRVRFTRNVLIRIDENNPLAEKFIDFVQDCDTKYLLPGRVPFHGSIDPDRHISASTVYNKVCEINENVWPHWIRDQRAYHLAAKKKDGGRDLGPYDHRAWFEWARMDMPLYYVGKRTEKDIAKALGITTMPATMKEEET